MSADLLLMLKRVRHACRAVRVALTDRCASRGWAQGQLRHYLYRQGCTVQSLHELYCGLA